MLLRRTALRVVGVGVAALILVAATQLLLLSFETDPLISRGRLGDVVDWIESRPSPGAAVLVGGALVVIALALLVAAVRSVGPDRRVITTRRRHGWTKLDRATLEDAFERHLEHIDRRNDVHVRVRRNGRVDLTIITPDPTVMGAVKELRDGVDEICQERSLPCRSGRIVSSTPRRMTSRRRVR